MKRILWIETRNWKCERRNYGSFSTLKKSCKGWSINSNQPLLRSKTSIEEQVEINSLATKKIEENIWESLYEISLSKWRLISVNIKLSSITMLNRG